LLNVNLFSLNTVMMLNHSCWRR